MTQITLTINTEPRTLTVPPMKRLLDVLREDLHLTGTKEGCGEGECGACAILLDGDLVNSCLIPALQANNTHITTIEGLAPNADSLSSTLSPLSPALHPIQQCFLAHGGAQCGICTPGMVLATHHLLAKHPDPHPRPNQRRPRRQPLPLHRLHAHLRVRPASRQRTHNAKPTTQN